MFELEESKPDRARVSLRDIGAGWLLVALTAAVVVLPRVLAVEQVGAAHAANVASAEIAVASHEVSKLLQQSLAQIAGPSRMRTPL